MRAHISGTAGPNDSGWVDLVDLRSNPAQIDLLSLQSPACILSQLGSRSGIAPGQYQQIRLHLLSNSPDMTVTVPAANLCSGSGFNCVFLASGGIQTLLLTSEAESGIKIPSGQISGGAFTVAAGQTTFLNIDFDACSSLVQQGNGQFRLKPVLHAGAISLNSNFISGAVVDSSTRGPVQNATVFIEQRDPNNPSLDRVIARTTTGPAGEFIACPLPPGNYDVVVSGRTFLYTFNPTATLQVPVGTLMGNIPLMPQAGELPATVSGEIVTTNAAGAATTADLEISALQPADSLLVTIPPLGNSISQVTSEGGRATYTLVLPAANPLVGIFSATPATVYSPAVAGPGVYQLNVQAFNLMSSSLNPGSPNCSPPSLPVPFDAGNQLFVTPGATLTRDFTFTGCQ